ncbi:MAG: hypothetical protein GY953_43095 [bacterium]|nr:hypothetical protein [bacterium]
MDSDGDGLLTKQEIEARMGQARGGRGPAPGRLMEGDENGDGKLTPEEIPERMRQRFDRMDANGDGFLTTDEIERMTRGRGRRLN